MYILLATIWLSKSENPWGYTKHCHFPRCLCSDESWDIEDIIARSPILRLIIIIMVFFFPKLTSCHRPTLPPNLHVWAITGGGMTAHLKACSMHNCRWRYQAKPDAIDTSFSILPDRMFSSVNCWEHLLIYGCLWWRNGLLPKKRWRAPCSSSLADIWDTHECVTYHYGFTLSTLSGNTWNFCIKFAYMKCE